MKTISRSCVLWRRSRFAWRNEFALLFLTALFLFSCAEKTKEAPVSGFEQAFVDAGLRLLSQTVSSRDFSLPIVFPALAAAEAQPDEVQSLSALKGKVVFLNFWATWCGPCRDEMPSMEVLYNRFKDKGLEILAVNCEESQGDVIAFMQNYGLTFPALLDEDGRVNGAYGIQASPTTFLVDRDGKIILRLVGSINWDTEKIHAAIESLLNST
jgi:thiol-disulfide isomerase/thioredoxin